MQRKLWYLGLAAALCLLVAWSAALAPKLVRHHAQFAPLRAQFMEKPLAVLNFNGSWGTNLSRSDGSVHPDWLVHFRTVTGTLSAQDVVDNAEIIVLVLPDRLTPLAEDNLTRALGLQFLIDPLRETERNVLIHEIKEARAVARWPFVDFTYRRFVVLFAKEALGDAFKKDCHTALITAWAQRDADVAPLIERCRLPR